MPGSAGHPPFPEMLASLTADVATTLAPRFQNVRPLGQGGMGLVFLARDPALKRDVAVKVLSPEAASDPTAHARFVREAESAAAVAHPNVVTIHQVGELQASGAPYFVMQFVEGRTLEDEYPRGTPVSESTARRIIAEIGSALAAAHARGVVHRDIKPANIMLDPQSGRAIVLDFGISAAIVTRPDGPGTRLTQKGQSLGTPQYMSPEQLAGDLITGKSDVYNLGLVAFELLTGRPVFEERTAMALAAAHLNSEPPRLSALRPEIDPALADIVQRCLAKAPAARPTAQDIVQLLQAVLPRIEWPPPGLEYLHRKGVALAQRARWQAAGATALMALLYLQPTMATGRWPLGETSWVWRVVWAPGFLLDDLFVRSIECAVRASMGMTCGPRLVDAGPLWTFALTALAVVLILGIWDISQCAFRLRRGLRVGADAGYPAEVAADVAWDFDDDTGALLEGVGAFALTTADERANLLSRRRSAAVWLLTGLVVTSLMPLAWLLGLVRIGDAGAYLVTLPELLVTPLPMLAAVIARRRILLPERHLRSRWRRVAPKPRRASEVSPSLVAGWLASGRALVSGRHAPQRALSPLSRINDVVGVALALAALALMLGAHSASSFWNGPSTRAMQNDLFDVSEGTSVVTWRWIDSTLASEVARLRAAGPDHGRVVARTPSTRVQLRTAYRPTEWDKKAFDAAITELAADSAWLWRRRWDAQLAAARSPARDRNALVLSDGKRTGLRARASAVLAFEAGDVQTALVRDRESLEFARYVISTWLWRPYQPVTDAFAAIALHRALSLATADTLGARTAELLLDRFERYRWANRLIYFSSPLSLSLMADPEDPHALRYVSASAGVAAGVRRQLALTTVLGLCANPREQLFGPSARRWELVARARDAVRDLPVVTRQLDSLETAVKQIARQLPTPINTVSRFRAICVASTNSKWWN